MLDRGSKLNDLLNHARSTVPYYQLKLPSTGEPLPDDVEDYLATLPLLSRRIIQSEKARLISTAGDASTWYKSRTTGTSGEPLEVILNQECRIVEAVLLALHIDLCLGSSEWRAGSVFHLTLHPDASSQALPALWHESGKIIKWNLIRPWQLDDEIFFDALTHINGAVVTVMPSVVDMLCSRLLSAGREGEIRPSLVLLSGEFISEDARLIVKEAFGCPVSSLYTMAEIGIVGTESEDRESYEVAEESAAVEIVDAQGNHVPPGVEGDIVVTGLNNLAMPLIRYQTGDRGFWTDTNEFRLVKTRKPRYLFSHTGSSVNIVRFAKVLAPLKVDAYRLDQETQGSVTFLYSAESPLDTSDQTLVRTVLRGALGPETHVHIQRVEDTQLPDSQEPAEAIASSLSIRKEPLGADLKVAADWLIRQLSTESRIEVALLTGSALEPETLTRFSDIDCVIFVDEDPTDEHWIDLANNLKSHIPKLSVNIDVLDSFSQRTPLTACRLLCEQLPLIGSLNEGNLSWPPVDALRHQGLYWAQESLATLWLRLAEYENASVDPLYEAWLVTKYILKALRYYYLGQGDRETATSHILSNLLSDPVFPASWKDPAFKAIQVSRELEPPPTIAVDAMKATLRLTLSYIRLIQEKLSLRQT